MRAEHTEYLKEIGLPADLRSKAEARIAELELLLGGPSDAARLYVGNYIEKKGVEGFDSLWLFAGEVVVESRNFWREEHYRIIPLKTAIRFIEIRKVGFELTQALRGSVSKEGSRMQVCFQVEPDVHCELNAALGNCVHLARILEQFLLPHVRSGAEAAQARRAGVR